MNNLTIKQEIFFQKIKEKYGENPLPSYEIIAKDFNFKHKNSVFQYFKKFRAENLIINKNNSFVINHAYFGAKLFSSSIRAGFATVIEDNIEKRISFDNEFNINAPSTFVFNVVGDSMVDVGVFEGDKVIIKKTERANAGDIVLANLDGAFTLKTLKYKNSKPYLHPENSSYPDMYPKSSLSIFGVVIGLVRKF